MYQLQYNRRANMDLKRDIAKLANKIEDEVKLFKIYHYIIGMYKIEQKEKEEQKRAEDS